MTNSNSSDTQLQQVYRKAFKAYIGRNNVTGVDIGFKYVNGQRSDDIVVRIHVREKIPESILESREVFPKEIDGVPIDIIEAIYRPTTAIEYEFERKRRRDTIQPGISISRSNNTAGTFGAVVYDNFTDRQCILSNWHVLAGNYEASPGDDIIQPGSLDGGRLPGDRIGKLERSILNEDGDAAIAFLDKAYDRSVELAQLETGVIVESARGAQHGDILEKSGRTTGVTRGKIDGMGAYTLSYSVGAKTIEGFRIVSVIDGNPNNEEISSGGDSGSIWYDPVTKEGVGLHFAGEGNPDPKQEHAIACHLPRVLDALNISLTPSAFGVSDREVGHLEQASSLSNVSLQQVIDSKLYIPYGDIGSSPLSTNKKLCREIQKCLQVNHYYTYTIDGLYGRITRTALQEFKEQKGLTGGDLIGPTTAKILLREVEIGPGILPPPFGPGRDNLARAVIKEGRRWGLTLTTQIAYIMATVQHEVAGTYKPIREWGGSSTWYAPYYGRGYVQLTHRSNYQKYSNILGIDLVGNPDRALERRIALFILVHGMANGTFTGKRLGQYVNVNQTDFLGARWVVNDRDKRYHIKNLANQWVQRLSFLEAATPEMAAADSETPEFIDENTELSEEERLMIEQATSI